MHSSSKQADYLLFYGVPGETTVISSKLPEYIRLHKPIIGICKGNEAAVIIQNTGTGEVCDFDESSISSLLVRVLNNEISYHPDFAEISKFERKYQTKQIAGIIKDVAAKAITADSTEILRMNLQGSAALCNKKPLYRKSNR